MPGSLVRLDHVLLGLNVEDLVESLEDLLRLLQRGFIVVDSSGKSVYAILEPVVNIGVLKEDDIVVLKLTTKGCLIISVEASVESGRISEIRYITTG